jgi:FkbH-like protein
MYSDFNSLKKNLKKEFSCKYKLKIAVLGDSATQLFCVALKGFALENFIDLNIYEADYNQIHLQLQNPQSDLYQFKPDYVIIFENHKKLASNFYVTPQETKPYFAQKKLQEVESYHAIVAHNLNAKLLYFNFLEVDDAVYGSYTNSYESSLLYQTRLINIGLMQLAAKLSHFQLVDVLSKQAQYGIDYLFDFKNYIKADMIFSLESLPLIAKIIVDQLKAQLGIITKCAIFDLDNTLWGGIIGDDGVEKIQIGNFGIGKVFTEIQYWAKELKKRGIILCVVSKNTENIALEPFLNHPDMILKMDDIAVFIANWDNKVSNIKKIQQILNIGFDSMVFIDDNPFERNMVKENIPEVIVPELPEDPSEYLTYLKSLNLFETTQVSGLDENRTEKYQTENARLKHASLFKDEESYLRDLNMIAHVDTLNQYNLPRASQLTLRSNQFNLRTLRCSEEELLSYNNTDGQFVINFNLKDKFGDHGLIAIILLKAINSNQLFIDNWAMSCRVLKRGMENFITNTLVDFASKNNYQELVGEYIPTAKNELVKNLYASLGFEDALNNQWILKINTYKQLSNTISNNL